MKQSEEKKCFKYDEMLSAINETKQKLSDPEFQAEMQKYQNTKDRDLLENEMKLSNIEREEKDGSRKKELQAMLQ